MGKKNTHLYRDGSLAIFKNICGPHAEKIKKHIIGNKRHDQK